MNATASTVWLASYPKSGNTWTRAVLRALALAQAQAATSTPDMAGAGASAMGAAARVELDLELDALGGGPIASSRAHLESFLGFSTGLLRPHEIDAIRPLCDTALDEHLSEVRFRKIHDRLQIPGQHPPIIPQKATRAAIYILRDPRDVALSFAHHLGRSPAETVAMMRDPDAALSMSTSGRNDSQVRQRLGTWSDHVRSWTEHDLFPTAVVRYEDLHVDAVGEFGRLAAFAGLDAETSDIEAAVHAARFERLQEKEAAGRFSERPPGLDRFFRRGQAGAWREELDATLVAVIEADHGETMRRFGYLPALTTY